VPVLGPAGALALMISELAEAAISLWGAVAACKRSPRSSAVTSIPGSLHRAATLSPPPPPRWPLAWTPGLAWWWADPVAASSSFSWRPLRKGPGNRISL